MPKKPLTLRRDMIETEEKKHLALWLAVGGTAALIVALWFMLLPGQMREMRLMSAVDASRWLEVGEQFQVRAAPTLDQGLAELKAELIKLGESQLVAARQSSAGSAGQTPAAAPIDIAALREKIEAAASGTPTVTP